MNNLARHRNSFMEICQLYFWTATIHQWHRLLDNADTKKIIVDSLSHLSGKGKIKVYAFVIMPNHLHLLWRTLEPNRHETSNGSFLKYTAHEFKKHLKNNPPELARYKVNAVNKSHEFWQRDPLAIELYTLSVTYQKLEYIHNNPVAPHWQLCDHPGDYLFSSAAFYETGMDLFGFLNKVDDYFYEDQPEGGS